MYYTYPHLVKDKTKLFCFVQKFAFTKKNGHTFNRSVLYYPLVSIQLEILVIHQYILNITAIPKTTGNICQKGIQAHFNRIRGLTPTRKNSINFGFWYK